MHAGLSVPCCACWAAADVEAVEEDLEQEEEDGIKLEAFNLKARPPWVLRSCSGAMLLAVPGGLLIGLACAAGGWLRCRLSRILRCMDGCSFCTLP